ncbi:DNA-binding NarL/FixJ family response regulator [Evansella vedderi]|uniref:DNA-binding NarL/FixJ family response regulator n=1 Tax=Evansella vedderi TaxID=38282 RepID=A0ABT9ZWS4_9BACI|nr:LuxR C-terminal-related transcriptional regulator [Evansella vedderi]MDQ0255675.1 DNA-binding NarL/FixJ family response regulator [Evansella vedderi]
MQYTYEEKVLTINSRITFYDNFNEIPSSLMDNITNCIKGFNHKLTKSPSITNHWIFFFISEANEETEEKVFHLCQSINQKNTLLILVCHNELDEDCLGYLKYPVNGIVSLPFLKSNYPIILRSLLEQNIFLQANMHLKLISEIESQNALKKQPIKKLILKKNKVKQFLNEKEQAILQLLLDGKNNKKIAETLYYANSSIATLISSILKKLDAKDRTDAAVSAIRNGWVKGIR